MHELLECIFDITALMIGFSQSPTTVLCRTTLTRTITLYELAKTQWLRETFLQLNHQPRSQGLSLQRKTLVAAGHVPPRIWVVTKNSLKGGRLRLLLSILSLQESVKCCHQNKHFFHVAPVCCIKVMSQCNTVQTPKKN